MVSWIERHLCEVTGYPPYDITEGLRENTCLGNFNALAKAVMAKNGATTVAICKYVKREYRLETLIRAWDSALSNDMDLVAKLIYEVASKYHKDEILAPTFGVGQSMVIMGLVCNTFGNPSKNPSAQSFGTALLKSISQKKGPALTEYLMKKDVASLVVIFRCLRFSIDKAVGTEVLDILSITKRDEFQAYTFSKTTKSNLALFNDMCLFGHYVCASLVPGNFVVSPDVMDSSSGEGSVDYISYSSSVAHEAVDEPSVLRSGRKIEKKKSTPLQPPSTRGRPGRQSPKK